MMQKRLQDILLSETGPLPPKYLLVCRDDEFYMETCYDGVETKTLVIVTGDKCLVDGESSFTAIVKSFLKQCWCVEIHSWLHSLHDEYIEIQRDYPQRFVVRPLDDALQKLVYI